MIAMATTLFIGVMIGFLGQRSRFCIVSGIRDFFLLRSTYRIQGFLGLILGAVMGFLIFKFAGGEISNFPMPVQLESTGYIAATIIGGIGIGFISVLAEGCPFRQHVMAGEGRESAIFYLIGLCIGIVYFNVVTIHLFEILLSIGSL